MAHPGGRPSKYKPEYAEQAYKYCLLGADDADLARMFEVEVSTVNNWKIKHPEFLDALKSGKEVADAKVSESLYRRATGYDQVTNKIFQYQGEPVIVPTVEHVQPDPTAAIFWLKNRRPRSWRDKQEIDLSIAPVTIVNDLDDG